MLFGSKREIRRSTFLSVNMDVLKVSISNVSLSSVFVLSSSSGDSKLKCFLNNSTVSRQINMLTEPLFLFDKTPNACF